MHLTVHEGELIKLFSSLQIYIESFHLSCSKSINHTKLFQYIVFPRKGLYISINIKF